MNISEDNKEPNERQESQEQNKSAGEMDDQAQSQTSDEPSEYSGAANASLEGTTEQEALGRAYEAARPSFELEREDEEETDDGEDR